MENPKAYLPFLGTKPHVVVLGQPRDVHVLKKDPLVCEEWHDPQYHVAHASQQVTHPNAKHFFFLTTVVPDIYEVLNVVWRVLCFPLCVFAHGPSQLHLPNYVTVPYLHVVHWSPYTAWQQRARNPQHAAKHHLVAAAFKIRPVRDDSCGQTRVTCACQMRDHFNMTPEVRWSRVHLFEQCMAVNNSLCVFQYAEWGGWGALQRCVSEPWTTTDTCPAQDNGNVVVYEPAAG